MDKSTSEQVITKFDKYSKYIQEQMLHKETRELFQCVYRIAKEQNYKNAMEIGVAWAITTIAILSANDNGHLLSIDSGYYINTVEEVIKHKLNLRWLYIREKSQEILSNKDKDMYPMTSKFDLICIDGSHYYEDVKQDLYNSFKLLAPGGVMIVDDYLHRYNTEKDYGVRQAVDEFVEDKKLKLKINNMAHGIVEIRR